MMVAVVMVVPVLMFMFMFFFIVIIIVIMPFDFTHPRGRGGHAFKIEQAGVQEGVERHVGIVAPDDFGLGLQRADDGADAACLVRSHLGYFIEQDEVAEFDLLDYELLDVVLADAFAAQGIARGKLVPEPQGVDHGGNAVEARQGLRRGVAGHLRDGAQGLGYRGGLADAARLNDDVVEVAAVDQLHHLFDEVHLEGAADAAVLQGDQVARVVLPNDAAFLDERGVDVHLADVVDDDGEAYAAPVGEYAVEEGCLAAAEIAREQQHRDLFLFHSLSGMWRPMSATFLCKVTYFLQ